MSSCCCLKKNKICFIFTNITFDEYKEKNPKILTNEDILFLFYVKLKKIDNMNTRFLYIFPKNSINKNEKSQIIKDIKKMDFVPFWNLVQSPRNDLNNFILIISDLQWSIFTKI
jgi:hypothetical protein